MVVHQSSGFCLSSISPGSCLLSSFPGNRRREEASTELTSSLLFGALSFTQVERERASERESKREKGERGGRGSERARGRKEREGGEGERETDRGGGGEKEEGAESGDHAEAKYCVSVQ